MASQFGNPAAEKERGVQFGCGQAGGGAACPVFFVLRFQGQLRRGARSLAAGLPVVGLRVRGAPSLICLSGRNEQPGGHGQHPWDENPLSALTMMMASADVSSLPEGVIGVLKVALPHQPWFCYSPPTSL